MIHSIVYTFRLPSNRRVEEIPQEEQARTRPMLGTDIVNCVFRFVELKLVCVLWDEYGYKNANTV